MQAQPPPVGPPRRNIRRNTPEQLTELILKGPLPSYHNVRRAWNVLGYHREARPAQDNFIRQINALWEAQSADKSFRGRKARAYMLDALRALGFRDPLWNANTSNLMLTSDRFGGLWATIPRPGTGRVPFGDAREYLSAEAPEPPPDGARSREIRDEITWQDFHRYQGFKASDDRYYRAIPVPKGADSLWHSVSYWIYRRRGNNNNGPDIMRHWQVKARIWTYFMQVLMTRDHERWLDYNWLQEKSKTVEPDFGTLSMARSLYASEEQGKPAFPHHFLLFVIADYFGTEVVLFHGGPYMIGQHQSDTRHAYTVYGHRRHATQNPPHEQILLITNRDKTHYDPVDFDEYPLHDVPGYSRPDAAAPAPSRRRTTTGAISRPDPKPVDVRVGQGGMYIDQHPAWRADMPPWWPPENARRMRPNDPLYPPVIVTDTSPLQRPPCHLARYNYLGPVERATLDQHFLMGAIDGYGIPNNVFVGDGWPNGLGPNHAPREIAGQMAHKLPAEYNEVVLTDEVWDRFAAGIDIPGSGWKGPGPAGLQEWREMWANQNTPKSNVDPPYEWEKALEDEEDEMDDEEWDRRKWQWRFGEDPMGLDGAKIPVHAVKAGRHMLEDPYTLYENDKWRVLER